MACNPTTGEFRLLDTDVFADAQSMLEPGEVLVQGTAAELDEMTKRIRLGQRELQNRAARRKQQKQSRRRNR